MKLLVVEDDLRIQTALKRGLQQEKFVVDTASEGLVGYDLAETGNYDVIILDLLLPGMDGISLCKKLREKKIATKVLMLTAKGQTQDKITGLDSGADDYLTKPFSFEELLARVRALSRRPNEFKKHNLGTADLVLDTQNFMAIRNQKEITLSAKEYALLEYLLRNKGKVVTKEQIISNVWDYDSDILPNTVEVFIKNLRNKIDTPFKELPILITTVRGFGYKIAAD